MEKTWDFKTDMVISGLHPYIRERAVKLVKNLEKKGIKLRIYSGLRTFGEQAEIYAKGRTKAGKIVSKAKPGQSYHNYGLAFDAVEIKNGKALWENPDWEIIGREGEKLDFEWGGRWTRFRDLPHLQDSKGLHHTELLARYNKGDMFGKFVNLA